MMEPVKIIECPRDAWQGLPRQIPTERKVKYLQTLLAAGFRHIDAVSFVSPKAVPQMADSEQVLKELGLTKDVEIIGIVVNEKGAERAIATGSVSTLGYPCSISETFLRRNQNQSLPENQALLKKVKGMADESGLAMVAYISMAFGNPYGDTWSETKVVEAAQMILDLGIRSISIADTVGMAEPELIHRVTSSILRGRDQCDVGVARNQRAHRIGVAGDDDLLDLEIAEPALLLRHVERQAERRRRSREHHFDLGRRRRTRIVQRECNDHGENGP